MSREDPQIKLRLPADLKKKVQETARVNQRTMNAEIVSCLEEVYATRKDFSGSMRLSFSHDESLEMASRKIAAFLQSMTKPKDPAP